MEVLSIDTVKSDLRVAQRAHHVLAFLVQFYVQSLPPRDANEFLPIRIPRSLAIPFVDISKHLDIAPIVSSFKLFVVRLGANASLVSAHLR
jgi:indoleamine 2,3-dioxygenase